MKVGQILVVETDDKLSNLLEPLAVGPARCLLRHPKRLDECRQWLTKGGPCVLVLHIGQNLAEEMHWLAEVSFASPETGIVVVGDASHAAAAGMAWDLGADYVLILPQPCELLPEIVAGLLNSPRH